MGGFVQMWRATGPILKARIDGESEPREVAQGSSYSLSTDGKFLAYQTPRIDDPGRWDIAVLSLEEDNPRPRILPGKSISKLDPQISPDGQYLAYISSDLGSAQLYLTRFPSGEGRWQVTSEGAARCFWGKGPVDPTIYYYGHLTARLYRINVTFPENGETPEFGEPNQVFNVNLAGLPHAAGVSPSRDGKRLLAPQHVGIKEKGQRQVILVENWLRQYQDGIPAHEP